MNDGLIDSPEDLYVFLTEQKFRVAANIIFAGSPGHQIHELDYLLRKRQSGEIPRDGKYLWIQRNGLITESMVGVYRDHFRQYNLNMIAQDRLFAMTSQLLRMVPELGIDVGMSHIKNSVIKRDGMHVARFSDDLYYHVTNDSVMAAVRDYFRLREATPDFDPWKAARPALDGPMVELLRGKVERIALVHARSNSGNAGVPVPPANLLPSLEYLRDLGFTVVKFGTEPCPEEFIRIGVINYSESPLRSFKNDVALMSHAQIALVNASGLENLLEIMDVPTVSYARWHLILAPYSKNTVVVPTLLFDPTRQKLLSFAEQVLFFRTRQEFWQGKSFGWHFPVDRFAPRVPQADEMLAAVQETYALGQEARGLTPAQERFRRLGENGVLSVAKCRVSEFFLERFDSLLW